MNTETEKVITLEDFRLKAFLEINGIVCPFHSATPASESKISVKFCAPDTPETRRLIEEYPIATVPLQAFLASYKETLDFAMGLVRGLRRGKKLREVHLNHDGGIHEI